MTDTTPMAPDRSNPDRCLSVHWSLPVQCVLHVAHRENWHETRHPETGNRLRYRYGALATEELRGGQWHDLGIPRPDNRSREQLRAEIARLTAELEKYTGWEPTVREEYEHACRESDRFAALLCVCAESVPPEHFDPDAQCPVHGDPAKALSLRAVMAERDELRARLAAAPSGLDVWILDDPEHREPGAYITLEAAQRDALNEAEAFVRVLRLPKPVFAWEPQGDEDWPDWVLLADGELTGWRVHHLLVNGADETHRAWLFWSPDGTLAAVVEYPDPVTVQYAQARYTADRDMPAATAEPVAHEALPAIRNLIEQAAKDGRHITHDDLKEILS